MYDLNKFNFNFWELYYSKFDFLICLSDRSQCLESHGMIDFAYKLQLHYNGGTTTNSLALKAPVRSFDSTRVLHMASMTLLKQQLKMSRTNFTQNKRLFDANMFTLKQLLSDSYYAKLLAFNISTSRRTHTEHLRRHKKKFQKLIDQHKAPYCNPYDSIKAFDISAPTFTGVIKQSKPVIRQDVNVVKNTVINLSDEPLEDEETSLLSLGLKFCPASDNDSVAKTSSKLEPVLKQLGHGVESAAAHEVTSTLVNSKQKPSNLNTK